MRGRVGFIGLLAALSALAIAAPLSPAESSDSQLSASVGNTPVGSPVAPGFVGVSMEFQAAHIYTGSDPDAINPALVGLLGGLAPKQSPVIRIGGDSTDQTWWPIRGMIPPGGIKYRLTKGWLRTTRALAADLNARLILGVNLAAGRPAIAAAEAKAFRSGIGRRYIRAIEIGNEPDVYGQFVWYRAPDGRLFMARRSSYNLADFTRDFSHWRAALPSSPIAGPAFAELTWLGGLANFISDEPGLSLLTVHRYPLRGCIHDPTSPLYASIPNLLSDSSSVTLAQDVAPYVQVAHDRGLPFRLDEMNSVACSGIKGVSNTFASALWVLDTLFNLDSVGVDGVNLHTLPGAGYELFTFKHAAGTWSAFVHPEYYGMLMFAQAAPPGSRLLQAEAPSGPLKVWATAGPGATEHIVLINKSTTAEQTVRLSVPNASTATVEWLQAPSASSTSEVSLGGRTFGSKTTTGSLPGRIKTGKLSATLGSYTIDVPPASAVMLTQ